MTNRSLLLSAVTLLLAGTSFVPRAAAQSDFWRDYSDWERRRDALNRVGENHETASRYRRHIANAPHLLDIKRLTAINLELAQAVSPGGALDFKFLAKSAAEINKLSMRLQTSLRFAKPKAPDEKNGEAKPEDLGASLSMLRLAITSFVDNPVFKKARVVDVNRSIKAAADLDRIIELSGQVERTCKRRATSKAIP
jgi:hypothetical protein